MTVLLHFYFSILLSPRAAVLCPYRVALAIHATEEFRDGALREKFRAAMSAHVALGDLPNPQPPPAVTPESSTHRLLGYLREFERVKAEHGAKRQAQPFDLEIIESLKRDAVLKGRDGLLQIGERALGQYNQREMTAFLLKGRLFLKAAHPEKPSSAVNTENMKDNDLRWAVREMIEEIEKIPDDQLVGGVREALFFLQEARSDSFWKQYAIARVGMSDLEVSPLLQGWLVVTTKQGVTISGMSDFSDPRYVRLATIDGTISTINRENIADLHPGVISLPPALHSSIMGGDSPVWVPYKGRYVRLVTTYLGINLRPLAVIEELGNPYKRVSVSIAELEPKAVLDGAIDSSHPFLRPRVELHLALQRLPNRLGLTIGSGKKQVISQMIDDIFKLGPQLTPAGCQQIARLKYVALRKFYPEGKTGEDLLWKDYEAGHLGLGHEQLPFTQWATPPFRNFLAGGS